MGGSRVQCGTPSSQITKRRQSERRERKVAKYMTELNLARYVILNCKKFKLFSIIIVKHNTCECIKVMTKLPIGIIIYYL